MTASMLAIHLVAVLLLAAGLALQLGALALRLGGHLEASAGLAAPAARCSGAGTLGVLASGVYLAISLDLTGEVWLGLSLLLFALLAPLNRLGIAPTLARRDAGTARAAVLAASLTAGCMAAIAVLMTVKPQPAPAVAVTLGTLALAAVAGAALGRPRRLPAP
jgi:hypothetical protein